MRRKYKSVIKAVLVIAILTIILQWLLPTMTSEEFKAYVIKVGILGPVIIISYTVLSHIVAPLTGSPSVILSWTVYGVIKGSLYLYISSMISAAINFWIAKKFGREWVTKLVGKSQMKDVDSFVKVSGTKLLKVCRIFGWPLFEIVSYAFGLTNMSFNKYYSITLAYSAIPSVFIILLIKDFDFTKPQNLVIWISGLIVTGTLFTLLIRNYAKKSQSRKK